MTAPKPMLQALEEKLLTILAPIVDSATDGKVKQIQVEFFDQADDLPSLLAKFRSRMPGAFLSVPSEDYPPLDVQTIDSNATYHLLIGITDRRKPDWLKNLVYAFRDNVLREIAIREVPDFDIQANVDFIRPTNLDPIELEGATAVLFSFVVGLRNLQL